MYGRVTAAVSGGSPRRGRAAPLALPPHLPHVGNRCFRALPARRHRISAGSCSRAADRRSRAGRSGAGEPGGSGHRRAGRDPAQGPSPPCPAGGAAARAARPRGAGPMAVAEGAEVGPGLGCRVLGTGCPPRLLPCPTRGQRPNKQTTTSIRNCPQATSLLCCCGSSEWHQSAELRHR